MGNRAVSQMARFSFPSRSEPESRSDTNPTTAGLLSPNSRSRALAKALCYRVLMFLTTVVIALVVLEDLGVAFDIGVATTVVKTGTYYVYERLWNRL